MKTVGTAVNEKPILDENGSFKSNAEEAEEEEAMELSSGVPLLSWYQLEYVWNDAGTGLEGIRRHLKDRVARYQQVSPLWMCLGSLLIVWRFLSGFLPYDLPGRFVHYTADVIDVFWGVIIMILFKM